MNDDIAKVACRIANLWQQQRLDRDLIKRLDSRLVRDLDMLEEVTRGDERRCVCLAGKLGSVHDNQCPAKVTP